MKRNKQKTIDEIWRERQESKIDEGPIIKPCEHNFVTESKSKLSILEVCFCSKCGLIKYERPTRYGTEGQKAYHGCQWRVTLEYLHQRELEKEKQK